MNPQTMYQMVILAIFVAAMYFILIKPQKKKEKETTEMRKSVTVGDEIVTIGGICGKVVKTKDESIVIQVGSDKTKLEFKRWAISSVEKRAESKAASSDTATEEKKIKPRRLGKKVESMEEETANLLEGETLDDVPTGGETSI